MKAIAIKGEFLGPESLKFLDIPFPTPKENEVVIKISYVGINNIDIVPSFGSRSYPPFIPGIECSGTIIDVGKDVDEWKVGDKVCALLDCGGYAKAVAVRATQILSIPTMPSITMLQAACLPHVACTTWEALIRVGRLSSNMTLLVFEGCGIICELAIQLAKMVQAKVIVVTGNHKILKYINALHPDLTLHARSPQFDSQLRQATGNRGVDIVLDCEPLNFDREVSWLTSGGRLVLINSTRPCNPTVNLHNACKLNVTLEVVDRMCWKPDYLASVVTEMREKMWPAFKNGDLKLPSSVTPVQYPLSEAGTAYIYLQKCMANWIYFPRPIGSRGIVLKP